MDKVDQSMLKRGIVASRVISNGVDLKIFHPADRTEARDELGLPSDAEVLLFTANGIIKNIWKDYRTLQSLYRSWRKIPAKNASVTSRSSSSPIRKTPKGRSVLPGS